MSDLPDLKYRQWRTRLRRKLKFHVHSIFRRSREVDEERRDVRADSQIDTEDYEDVVLSPDEEYINDLNESDEYRWAFVHENQRGFMLFSIPHYTGQSLLPADPPPFSNPSHKTTAFRYQFMRKKMRRRVYSSLDDYQLPDANWRWVSESWIIDMQWSDTLQHDGFEYNWFFRSKGWRANPGILSSGGIVRRRRWRRLMVRPGSGSSLNRNSIGNVQVHASHLRIPLDAL